MSHEIGMKLINLEPTPRVGRTEYCFTYPSLIEHISGIYPDLSNIDVFHESVGRMFKILDFDLLWHTNDGPMWEGRWTNMGHAEFREGGTDMDYNVSYPFQDPEEVLEFDAASEYGLPDTDAQARLFQEDLNYGRKYYTEQVYTGGYYKTIVSAAIQAFGWDMLLMAAGLDPKKFGEDVLECFFKLTQANIEAWLKTDMEVFISHDDMVWTDGAIFKPEFYREYIFPRYKELWRPIKERGIKVLFCADGTYTEFVDDIAAAGADGFIFEPTTNLEYIAEKYGKTHVMVGNADCRILTWGTKEDIKAEVDRCMKAAKDCPGFFMCVGNHIPANVPLENALYYFDMVKQQGVRKG